MSASILPILKMVREFNQNKPSELEPGEPDETYKLTAEDTHRLRRIEQALQIAQLPLFDTRINLYAKSGQIFIQCTEKRACSLPPIRSDAKKV